MTRARLKAIRAQASLTAYRTALDWLRHREAQEVERLIVSAMQPLKDVLRETERQQEQQRIADADAEYRKANDL